MKPLQLAALAALVVAVQSLPVASDDRNTPKQGLPLVAHIIQGQLQIQGLNPEWQVLSVTAAQSELLEFETEFSWDGGTGGSRTLLIKLPPLLHWSRLQGITLQELVCRGGQPVQPLGTPGSSLIWQWRPEGHTAASEGAGFGVTVAVGRGGGCMAGRQPAVAGASRALLQDISQPEPSCTLQVGAQTFQFDYCSKLNTMPESQYQIFYSLAPSPDGTGTVWKGGVRVLASQFPECRWAGLAFPEQPATMIGSNAVIVRECDNCSSGASVNGCVLKGYVPEMNVMGSFPVTDPVAAKDKDGFLVAAYTAFVPKPLGQLAGPDPADLNYAIGPLADDGTLKPHLTGGPFGGTKVLLKSAGSAAAGGSPEPDPPAAEPSSSPAAAPAVAPAAPAAGSTPPAPAAGVESVPQGGVGHCGLSVGGGTQLTFEACTPVQGVGNNFHLFWTVAGSPSGSSSGASGSSGSGSDAGSSNGSVPPGKALVKFGMNATTDGWVAVGFPATPAHMIGSTALVLRVCTACSSGVQLLDYFLGAKDPSAVQPPGKLPVSNLMASTAPGGWLQGAFEVELDAAAASAAEFPLIFAAGSVAGPGGPAPAGRRRQLLSEYNLQQHSTYGAASLNLAAGSSSGVSGPDPSKERMKNAHAWMMVISWGVLLPSGVVVARSFKTLGPVWFQIHRAVQIVGLATALAAFILIFQAVPNGTVYTLHRRLGISAMTLGLTQLTALVLRPHHDSRWRRPWNQFHWWVGRAAILVAVANIYEGIIHVKQVGSWGVIAYTVVFSCIVAAGMLKDGWDYVHLPPPALMEPHYPSARVEREEALKGHVKQAPPAHHSSSDSSSAGQGGSKAKLGQGGSSGAMEDGLRMRGPPPVARGAEELA